MKLYRIVEPSWLNLDFAELSPIGTWSSSTGVCYECGGSNQERVQPLVAEWQPGSDLIADVTWAAFQPVLTCKLFCDLRSRFRGFTNGPVEYVQDPKLKRPVRVTRRNRRRVWLPYDGPELCEVWVAEFRHLAKPASTAEMTYKCRTCGRERWEVIGIERWEYDADALGFATWTNYQRQPDMGLYARPSDLSDIDVFRFNEFPAWIICTEQVRTYVLEGSYSNVGFLEIGELEARV